MKEYAGYRSRRVYVPVDRAVSDNKAMGYTRMLPYRRKGCLIWTALFAVLAASLTLLLILHGFHAQAATDSADRKFKYYQSVTIHSGDSLDGFAARYADPAYYPSDQAYIREVVGINHLQYTEGSVARVTPGTHLIIPYYSEEYRH